MSGRPGRRWTACSIAEGERRSEVWIGKASRAEMQRRGVSLVETLVVVAYESTGPRRVPAQRLRLPIRGPGGNQETPDDDGAKAPDDDGAQTPPPRRRQTYQGGRFFNRQFTRACDEIMGGGGQPHLDNNGNHVRYEGRENRAWEGAYEYEVRDPSGRLHHDSRILVLREGGRPDGRILKMAWVNPEEAGSQGSGNKYKHIHEFPENF